MPHLSPIYVSFRGDPQVGCSDKNAPPVYLINPMKNTLTFLLLLHLLHEGLL